VIRLRHIRYRYPHTGWVLKGVDFSVRDCDYLFIGGANGSGKSTLAYLFNGLIPHYFGGTLQGTVTIDDLNTLEHKVFELVSHVGLVLQNADAQLFNSTVEDEIAFGLESLGLPGGEIDNRIREISRTLRLEDILGRSPATLSGGEKRLVAIASVLCLNPSVLLLDEPYGDLDWDAVERVRQALLEVNRSGKTVIVIEQRLGNFLHDTTRCLILEKGKLLYEGGPQSVHEVLLDAHLLPQYSSGKNGSPGKGPLLIAENLSYRIKEKEILREVSLELREGETLAIIGRNGSGKTTLLKHFNGLLRPTTGRVTFEGEEIQGKAPSELAAQVGLSFQNPNDQFFKYRVKDEVMAGPRILRKIQKDWLQEMWQVFELHELLDRSPYRLSEGEKKRVSLASILATRPKLLVLDEPTSGQDGRFREALARLVAELKNRGFTIVIATHDLDFAQATASRWIVLHEGRVVADGAPEDLRADKHLVQLGALPSTEEHFISKSQKLKETTWEE
jgi:energy-coupling factor transporter ATP-binding protein EcfA2